MIGEEASDHLLEPSPLLGDRLVHAPSQFLLDPPKRCPHAIAETSIFLALPSSLNAAGLAPNQPGRNAHRHHTLKDPAQGIALSETFATRTAEYGVVRYFVFDTELAEPAIGKVYLNSYRCDMSGSTPEPCRHFR